jgi:hypothetical protein
MSLKVILGHSTLRMVERYSHLSTGNKRYMMNNLTGNFYKCHLIATWGSPPPHYQITDNIFTRTRHDDKLRPTTPFETYTPLSEPDCLYEIPALKCRLCIKKFLTKRTCVSLPK